MLPTSSLGIAVKTHLDEAAPLEGGGPTGPRFSVSALPALWRRSWRAKPRRETIPRKAGLCLLRANGQMVGSDGEERDPAGAHLLVLARELCRFHLFPVLEGAPRGRTEAAAEIYCESQSPFETCDSLKLRTSRGIAIWSWDPGRVRELIGERGAYYRDRIVPEPLVYPPGQGWTQRADIDGFEAQYWEDGTLLASMWRRRPFEPAQWLQFTSDVASPLTPPPAAPPEPERLSLPAAVGATPPRVRPRWGRAELERGVAALALLGLLFGSYLYGQTLQYERLAAADVAAMEASMARGNTNPLVQEALHDLELTRAFVGMSGGTAPLTAAAEAFALLGRYGFAISEWRVDDLVFQARISPVPDLALVHDAASVMESHPLFVNVTARTDRAGGMLIFEAELDGPGRARTSPETMS